MHNVISFPPCLLEPFLGTWIRDPLSVSPDKVVKRMLGENGFDPPWRCGSIADIRQCLRDDVELAAKYAALCKLGSEARLIISRHLITWTEDGTEYVPARTANSPIARTLTIPHCLAGVSQANPAHYTVTSQ